MNIYAFFRKRVFVILEDFRSQGLLQGLPLDASLPETITAEPARDPAHGDIAINAALVLQKAFQKPPRVCAQILGEQLKKDTKVARVEIAGPGFINIFLKDSYLYGLIPKVLAVGGAYGADTRPQENEVVHIEYVSANPTGPLHVGHARGAVFGDTLANLLEKVGFKVTREYYINDAGNQVEQLVKSVWYRVCEGLGEKLPPMEEDMYPGSYLTAVSETLIKAHGRDILSMKGKARHTLVRTTTLSMMMDMIKDDLAALGIRHDVFFSEESLLRDGSLEKAIAYLRDKDLVYEGVLESPKGKVVEDFTPQKQTLFRATKFGDDSDRVVRKPDGSWTYFSFDIAYHLNKYHRGFSRMIDVWGADHGGYIARLVAAVDCVTQGHGELTVKVCQLVRLLRDGKPVSMSKRSGNFVTTRNLVTDVGCDAVRFTMLMRKNDVPLDFDYARVVERSRDNPVFYVQYAYARICSALRYAQDNGFLSAEELCDTSLAQADMSCLEGQQERVLMRFVLMFPYVLASAARAYEPHRLSFFLYDMAATLHELWNLGQKDPTRRFVEEGNKARNQARLALVRCVGCVFEAGFAVLGITARKEMR